VDADVGQDRTRRAAYRGTVYAGLLLCGSRRPQRRRRAIGTDAGAWGDRRRHAGLGDLWSDGQLISSGATAATCGSERLQPWRAITAALRLPLALGLWRAGRWRLAATELIVVGATVLSLASLSAKRRSRSP